MSTSVSRGNPALGVSLRPPTWADYGRFLVVGMYLTCGAVYLLATGQVKLREPFLVQARRWLSSRVRRNRSGG